jgi:hypothetical protein
MASAQSVPAARWSETPVYLVSAGAAAMIALPRGTSLAAAVAYGTAKTISRSAFSPSNLAALVGCRIIEVRAERGVP